MTSVAIIGAGIGGICALRHIILNLPKIKVSVFEIAEELGGVWVYSDETGNDEYGMLRWGKMYKSLRTNLPLDIMHFFDYPYSPRNKSFVTRDEFLSYVHRYVDRLDLNKYIKFRHHVTSVKPQGNKWEINYRNLKKGSYFTETFDYVIVCSGTFPKEAYPIIKGMDVFKGSKIHSRFYRKPDSYENKTVLVIGSGSSGLDISIELAKVAKKLILSHHQLKHIESPFPPNYIQKPDVKEFYEDSVTFIDGSNEKIDCVVYCTGYGYDCPFLDPTCGVKVFRSHITPLYKHIVNIEHPTMFFIGVPHTTSSIVLRQTQANYIASILSKKFALPSKEDMLKYIEDDYSKQNKAWLPDPRVATHMLRNSENLYYNSLTCEAGLPKVPPVYCAIRYGVHRTKKNLYTFRNYNYSIVDDEHYALFKEGESMKDNPIVYDSSACLEDKCDESFDK